MESGDRYLRAHAAPLRSSGDRTIGAVVVLHDVTQLRRLETMRRDFVANVSHELKTPITSIKGFTETLMAGASETREDRDRFISIIAKQSERLEAIIEDLLVLSRIEHDTESNDVSFAAGRVDRLLQKAVQACLKRAAEARIKLTLDCENPIEVEMNAQLLEQAILNLIDNAIKYSEPDTEVVVGAECNEDEIILRVTDQGPGIAARHLPRIFERFYRVDKSRSRNLGGTGLGLAIVKRIAIAHGGRVDVRSEVGQGSVFSIHLPLKKINNSGAR
jgi:two-component system phosphate regulon sensor histidine kinase PhoR